MGNYGRRWGMYNRIKGSNTATASTADKELFAAPSAGRVHWVSKISIANTSASVTTAVYLKSGTTTIWTFIAPFGGGSEPEFPDPICCAAGEALNFACSVSTSSVTVSAAGYTTREGEY